MRRTALALLTAAFAVGAVPAAAQSVNDDARCFLLSNNFAKRVTEPKARLAAAQGVMFYLGRLDSRVSGKPLADILKKEGPAIDPKAAGPQMATCVQRMGRSQEALQAAMNSPPPPPANK